MKILHKIFVLTIISLVSCTKQTQKLTETIGDTTGEIVSHAVDSLITGDSLSVFQRNIKKIEEMGEAIAIYAGEGKSVKANFKHDAEGTPVVVLTENNKELPWLYEKEKTDSTVLYKNGKDSDEFFVKGNGAIFKQAGKTYNLIAE